MDRSVAGSAVRPAGLGIGPTLLGAARFDAAAYRSIATERRFLGASVVVVVLAAVSHAALGVTWAHRGGWAPIRSVVPAVLSHFAIWLGLSVVGFGIGRILGSKGTLNGFVRAVGVASFPAIFYAVGVVAEPLLLVMAACWIASTYVAVRGSLELGTASTAAVLTAGSIAGFLLAGITTISVLTWLE